MRPSLILRLRLDILGAFGAAAGLFGFFWFLSDREFAGAILSAMTVALGLIAMQATINAKRSEQTAADTVLSAPTTTFRTSREIAASPDQVFAAFSDPRRLARWWGPAGFTNTFAVCEFRPGGRWSFVMHGPNGANHPNENVFAEIDPPRKVVVQHVSEPRYRLTIALAASKGGTMVSWEQVFEREELAQRLQSIVIPANDQNLDRLAAEVLHPSAELD